MTLEQVLEANGTTLGSIQGHYYCAVSADELETPTKEIGKHDGTTVYAIESDFGTIYLAECADGSAHVVAPEDFEAPEIDGVVADVVAVVNA